MLSLPHIPWGPDDPVTQHAGFIMDFPTTLHKRIRIAEGNVTRQWKKVKQTGGLGRRAEVRSCQLIFLITVDARVPFLPPWAR